MSGKKIIIMDKIMDKQSVVNPKLSSDYYSLSSVNYFPSHWVTLSHAHVYYIVWAKHNEFDTVEFIEPIASSRNQSLTMSHDSYTRITSDLPAMWKLMSNYY